MKTGIFVGILIMAALIAAGELYVANSAVTVESVAPVGPQREPYRAPVWVTNEQGQRCIQQATTVTCG